MRHKTLFWIIPASDLQSENQMSADNLKIYYFLF